MPLLAFTYFLKNVICENVTILQNLYSTQPSSCQCIYQISKGEKKFPFLIYHLISIGQMEWTRFRNKFGSCQIRRSTCRRKKKLTESKEEKSRRLFFILINNEDWSARYYTLQKIMNFVKTGREVNHGKKFHLWVGCRI